MSLRKKKEPQQIICPQCSTFTYEKVCPNCGQALTGWEYKKAVAATRSVYNRVYAGYDEPHRNQSSRAWNYVLVLFTFLLPSVGLMWVTAEKRRLRPIWKIITGVYVAGLSAVLLFVKIAPLFHGIRGDHLFADLFSYLVLMLLPGLIGIFKGAAGLRRQ